MSTGRTIPDPGAEAAWREFISVKPGPGSPVHDAGPARPDEEDDFGEFDFSVPPEDMGPDDEEHGRWVRDPTIAAASTEDGAE
jgi:hypothetical protein